MSIYRVLRPINWSGRREQGETLEMTDDEASAFGPEYLELLNEQKKDSETPSSEPDEVKTKKGKK